ncbi:MAG: hypothetical protein K2Z81_04020 [Cyanobacteria bacterium]|nr:hypothetical protein [Cyanobacteriota bacterium]
MKWSLRFVPAVFVSLIAVGPACAQNQYGSDPGASGIVDGSDVYQFLTSGPIIDPVRMEEASRKFDRTIKLPPRITQAKSWDAEMQREGSGASGAAFNSPYSDPRLQGINRPRYNNDYTQPVYSTPGANQGASQGASSAAQSSNGSVQTQAVTSQPGAVQSAGTPGYASNSASNRTAIMNQAAQHHQSIFGRMGMAFLRACDVVGFPVSDEFLPGDVDASLAGDLPPGNDPRVYVHEHEAKQALDRDEEQPPTMIMTP